MSDTPNRNSNDVLTQELVRDLLKERRRDRRWRNVRFFLGFFLIVGVITALVLGAKNPNVVGSGNGAYVALVRLNGTIAPGEDFSVENSLPALRDAFEDEDAKGVIIEINSGGGTPVQASIIHDEIIKLKNKYHKKAIVVGDDMLASGAYFVAVSGDKIFVNANTVTGSIGVIMSGFGMTDLIKKIGVDRRVYTSGTNKDRLDPFLPETPENTAKIQSVVDEVHQNFNTVVQQGRQGKLKGDPAELFSGDFWTGQTALKLGLVDGIGNIFDVMQSEFNVSRYKDYSGAGNVLKALAGQLGSSLTLPLQSQKRLVATI
jgi:protease-4